MEKGSRRRDDWQDMLETDPIIYPSIKEGSSLIPVEITKERVTLSAEKVSYFSLDFRLSVPVLNAIAVHYQEEKDYPGAEEDEDEQRFLIGPQLCQLRSKAIAKRCPYLKKVLDIVQLDGGISLNELLGIYLLQLDHGEQNRQMFMLMTRDKLYIRNDSLTLKCYDYADIVLDAEGVYLKSAIVNLEPQLLDYMLDKRFVRYFNDFMQLKFAILSDRAERHPFSGIRGGITTEYQMQYLDFMVQIALAERRASVCQILYLESLAREFSLGSNLLQAKIQEALKKKLSDRKIQEMLIKLLRDDIEAEYRYVFYQDALRMSVNDKGELNQKTIQTLLSKDSYAGAEFVKSYLECLQAEQTARAAMETALQKVKNRALTLVPLFRAQRYYRDLDLKMLRTGVMYNDYERI